MTRAMAMISAAVAVGLVTPGPARGETSTETSVRTRRPTSVVLAPEMLVVRGHDVTIPVPGLRLGRNLSRRVALDFAFGLLPVGVPSVFVEIGARWFVTDRRLTPYLVGRLGAWTTGNDEGEDPSLSYAVAGAGVELATHAGFTASVEVAPAIVRYEGANLGATFHLGAGWRF